jgi:hypothetical protein
LPPVVFSSRKHLIETLITGRAATPTQNSRYPYHGEL